MRKSDNEQRFKNVNNTCRCEASSTSPSNILFIIFSCENFSMTDLFLSSLPHTLTRSCKTYTVMVTPAQDFLNFNYNCIKNIWIMLCFQGQYCVKLWKPFHLITYSKSLPNNWAPNLKICSSNWCPAYKVSRVLV